MQSIDDLLRSLNFTRKFHVRECTSIADLFPARKRCGIYVLQFSNGEAYVGQAVDVTRRYVQHRQTHDDIERIHFRVVSRKNLNEEERNVIWTLEQNGYHLRNIIFTSVLQGEADFDLADRLVQPL
jgi:hypothetical protein